MTSLSLSGLKTGHSGAKLKAARAITAASKGPGKRQGGTNKCTRIRTSSQLRRKYCYRKSLGMCSNLKTIKTAKRNHHPRRKRIKTGPTSAGCAGLSNVGDPV